MVKRGSFAALLGALFAVGCDDVIAQPKVVQLKHDEPVGPRDGGHVVPPPVCSNESCCPKPAEAPECYPGGKNPSEYSGAECFAQRDNTGEQHRQLRQTQSISTRPPGNKGGTVADILLLRSGLHSACTPGGVGGFIQLMDFDNLGDDDPKNDVALTGFAAFVQEQSDALTQGGLCFVEDTYDDSAWALTDLYAPTDWPTGLPHPQPMPWTVKPVRAVRYTEDFDLRTDREAILEALRSDGPLAKDGFTGIYYSDETRGYSHGYAPLGYIVTQESLAITTTKPTAYNAVPIREAEITTQLNDPKHPNCAGVFGANELPTNCATSTASPAWSCPPGNCGEGVLGSTKVEGYFLTVEVEQVHVGLLKQTLCYSLPGSDGYPSWPIEADADGQLACRNAKGPKGNWNPMDPVNGIPPGDWCARTNSQATADCHDAWKSVSYSTFQAFPIQVGTRCHAL